MTRTGASASTNPGNLVSGYSVLTTPNGDSAMDETNDAVRVNVVAGVTSDTAHDAAYTEAPVGAGLFAVAHGANPTGVTAGDKAHNIGNQAGVPFVIGGHPNIVTIAASYTAAQTNTAVVALSGTLKYVITHAQVTCDNANTVDVGFYLGFHASVTPTTTGVVLTHAGVAPGSGISCGDGSGIIGIGAAGAAILFTCEVPTTGAVRVKLSYYSIES